MGRTSLRRAFPKRCGRADPLRRTDIDFARGQIHWCADTDKRRKTRMSPLPKGLAPDLQRYLHRDGSSDSPFIFSHPLDPTRPLDKDRADTMLERACRLAGVARAKGGLWHPFRRRWATNRKRLPLTDVAQTGGWDDVRTLLTCYQLADPDTMRRVADFDG